ncbi:MAG: GAF domain-containing sensor histidine kinase, partial [Chloroflexi bacterium]|nr:GAF domain-containing sensor histidine kinase [Chloroflexota bacterium]
MSARPQRESVDGERLQLVLDLGQRVTSMLDIDVLLPEACRLIAETFDYDLVGINLLDPLHPDRLYQAAAFPTERRLPRSFRVPLGRGITGWVARHGRPLLVNDVTRTKRYIPGPGREKTRAELDVPLRLGPRTIGVLNVESERRMAFASDAVPYLQGLAGQIAQAIENARLAAQSRELAVAQERARLARDLHDETIQSLVALGRQLDLLALDLDEPSVARERLERVQSLVVTTLDGVRRLSQNQRPAALEDLGLVAALRSHAASLAELGLRVSFTVRGEPLRLPPVIESAVYRVAQEALSNVARHSGVSSAVLELSFSSTELRLCVRDNGAGFDRRQTPFGQGLRGMYDRVA